ncbi:energy-coupling factor transporter transmembrane protein EcfT [Paeniglutamicibacter sp. ABSL32-1]|uniref:energy-coupling factor transporter transmembrane component T family protein n=1 Tax=Paeniglutamicibacter quisquiliarum TaxID=2849498 RepID=UPI001C2CFD74|nr:CbiQ family ECF transporter T component [Paeniglutamicibacter quisquiliarum]MBV1778508.1 energy-coupling factor transporter transmembrane protein EcfT [Paeniglutamicibacter quisquiliarum]
MLTLYRPGSGWLHRLPAGPKLLLVLFTVLAVSLLPSHWWTAAAAAAAAALGYALAGLGPGMAGIRELGRQVHALRWVIGITLASQLVFMGPEPAVANAARVTAAIALASLLALTTRVTELLDAIERGLRPLQRLGLDPQRIALLLTVAIGTIPVLGRRANEVREAQRARGARNNPRTFVVPFLIVALKHADELGDALTARGVR